MKTKRINVILLSISLALTSYESAHVHENVPEIDDKRYVGCYQDKLDDPAFLIKVDLYGDTTIDGCILSCINLKFPFTGLQNGDTCYCGSEDYGQHGTCSYETCRCDVPCEGENMEACGGLMANSVYVTECPHGWYTTDCNMPCHCLDNKKCDMTSGHCNGPCDPGWQGPVCNQACDEGMFGQNCTGVCHCEKGACDAVSGECPGDCAAGWSDPPYCQTPCSGESGEDCEQECHCQLPDECDPETGHCSGDCADGWEDPPTCDTACQDGNFGFDCQHVCHCKDGIPCHTSTGYCPGECADGWTGHPTCQTPTNERYMGCYEDREDNRTFSLLWAEDITTIESCIDICYSLGRKYSGLQNGVQCYCGGEEYKARAECQDKTCYCNTPCEGNNNTACGGSLANSVYAICPAGWWGGTECNTQCGHCINNETCDMLTGICENGCAMGWSNTHCTNYDCPGAFDVLYDSAYLRADCGGHFTEYHYVHSLDKCIELACMEYADTLSFVDFHFNVCYLHKCNGPVDFFDYYRPTTTISMYKPALK